MISLETLSTRLSIGETELIDELILALLATPQLTLFFEKFPRMKQAMLRDLPRWHAEIAGQMRSTPVPAVLAQEFQLFERLQLLSSRDFSAQLPHLLEQLQKLPSPFLTEARMLLQRNEGPELSNAQHRLFLQRWRLSLTLQTLTLNETLLEAQRERLLAELQQRMALSGQLAPVLSDEDEAAAGRLWDLSKASLQPGDYTLIVQYGAFLAQQPELMQLAQQLGRSREAKSVPSRWKRFISWCMSQITCRKRSAAFIRAMMCCACCRRNWPRSVSVNWSWNFTGVW